VKVTGRSRGRGFAGVVQRWNFNGGPATHGSGFHRKPGSVGNRTEPGRVMPGKRMAGHFGDETNTIRNIEIVDVMADEGVILVKGSVPGHRNSLIRLMKV
jgi:large subunit ribosomal protein L3